MPDDPATVGEAEMPTPPYEYPDVGDEAKERLADTIAERGGVAPQDDAAKKEEPEKWHGSHPIGEVLNDGTTNIPTDRGKWEYVETVDGSGLVATGAIGAGPTESDIKAVAQARYGPNATMRAVIVPEKVPSQASPLGYIVKKNAHVYAMPESATAQAIREANERRLAALNS